MLLSWGGDRVRQQTVRHISGTSAQRGHPLNPGTCMLSLAQRSLRDPSWNKTSVRLRKATTREDRKTLLLRKPPHDGGRGRRNEWSPEHPSWGTSPLTPPHSTMSRRCSHSSGQFSGAPWPPPAGGRGLPSASWCGRTLPGPVLLLPFGPLPGSQREPALSQKFSHQRVCTFTPGRGNRVDPGIT